LSLTRASCVVNCKSVWRGWPAFLPAGSGDPEGYLFPWVVSDFSLMDAIESGIVKLPRVPVSDNLVGVDTVVYRDRDYIVDTNDIIATAISGSTLARTCPRPPRAPPSSAPSICPPCLGPG
jgi:hypothetical protein